MGLQSGLARSRGRLGSRSSPRPSQPRSEHPAPLRQSSDLEQTACITGEREEARTYREKRGGKLGSR